MNQLAKKVELALRETVRTRTLREQDVLDLTVRRLDKLEERGITPPSKFELSQSSSYPERSGAILAVSCNRAKRT